MVQWAIQRRNIAAISLQVKVNMIVAIFCEGKGLSMIVLCWAIVSIHILIADTEDRGCSWAFDEYYVGLRKCCDGKLNLIS